MAGFSKLEKRQITERKDGAIYKTKIVGYEWFEITKQPKAYEPFTHEGKEYQWVATGDYHFGPTKPTS